MQPAVDGSGDRMVAGEGVEDSTGVVWRGGLKSDGSGCREIGGPGFVWFGELSMKMDKSTAVNVSQCNNDKSTSRK